MVDNKPLKIKVDKELCVSVASCVAIAGNTFELDSDGIATVKNPKGDDNQTIIQAAQSCPTKAIIITDAEGNKIWPKD